MLKQKTPDYIWISRVSRNLSRSENKPRHQWKCVQNSHDLDRRESYFVLREQNARAQCAAPPVEMCSKLSWTRPADGSWSILLRLDGYGGQEQDCPKNKKHHILTPARAHFTPSHLHAPEALFTQSAERWLLPKGAAAGGFYENSWLFTWKIQNAACKSIKRWYIISPLRLMMVRHRADITREMLFWNEAMNPKKNRRNFKKLLAKFKKCDILCFCCASKTTRQQGW